MDNDFRPAKVKYDLPWREIYDLNQSWKPVIDTAGGNLLKGSLRPYVYFVSRLSKGFTWSQRLVILFTGRLPNDF